MFHKPLGKRLLAASPIEDRKAAGCAGKISYASPQLANDTIRRMRSNIGRAKRLKDLTAYHCRYCGMYHLGRRGIRE